MINRKLENKPMSILIFAVLLAAVLLMTSCPPQITAPMVALAEDEIEPTLNIISPRGGDNYYSTVTVTGLIYDDVLVEGDESGLISSISYEIANDDFRKGKIDIGPDDSIVADEDFGTGTIDYNLSTGEFSFTFSTLQTITQPQLRDVVSLTITVVDRNNNKSIEQINLMESNGPYVDFSFYDSSDYSEGSKITYLSGDSVYLGGTIANSDYQLDTANEIVELNWTVAGTGLGATLDITPGSPHWLEGSGFFETLNAFEDAIFFRYDPVERFFYTETFIDVSDGSQTFFVTAVDAYGHSTTASQLLTKPASLMMQTPTSTSSHYATNPDISDARTISISTKVTDPADGVLTSDQIDSVECTFSSTLGSAEPITHTIDVYTSGVDDFNTVFNMGTDPGRINFDIDTSDWPATGGTAGDGGSIIDLTGDVWVKITVREPDEDPRTRSVLIQRDDDDPTITGISFTGGTSGYLKRGDTGNLSFTTNDGIGSGVSNIKLVEINSATAASDLAHPDSNFTLGYTVDPAAVSGAAGSPFGYSIQIYDDAGNGATAENLSAKTFYGPYSSNSYTISLSDALTNTGNLNWARAAGAPGFDTVSVEFNSPRLLTGKPDVSIAGQAVDASDVTYNSGSGLCTAELILDGSEGIADYSLIQLEVSSTDIVGNTETLITATDVQYDATAPLQPSAPVWGGTYSPYINSSDMSGTDLTMNAGRSLTGATSGETIELYLDNSSGNDFASSSFGDTTTPSTAITYAKTLIGGTGPKTIYSRVIDVAGNTSGYSPVLGVTVDTTPPTVDAGNDLTGSLSKTATFIHDGVNGPSASDANGIAIYSWAFDAGCNAVNTAALNPTINSCDADGTYTGTLTVTDSAGNQNNNDFDLVWDAVQFTPGINGLTSGNIYNADIPVSADISGAESGILSYSWSASNGNFSFIEDPAHPGDEAYRLVTSAFDGSSTISLTITDNLSRQDSVDITNINLDTEPPPAPISVSWSEASDGFINFNEKNDTAIDVIVTYNSALVAAGDNIQLQLRRGSSSWTIISTYSADGDGSDTLTFNGTTTSALSARSDNDNYYLRARITDVANNDGEYTSSSTFDIDTVINTIDAGDDYMNSSARTSGWTHDDGTSGGDDHVDAADSISGIASAVWSFAHWLPGDTTVPTGAGVVTVTDSDTTDPYIVITSCDLDGRYVGTLTVTDNAGNFDTNTFQFEWDLDDPTADAGVDRLTTNAPPAIANDPPDYPGPGFSQLGSGTDAGSGIDPGEYQWYITGPQSFSNITGSGATLNVQNGGTVDADLATDGSRDGIYTATLTVKDYKGRSHTDSFEFLWDTKAPVLTDIPDQGDKIAPYVITPVVSDPECDDGLSTPGSQIESYLWQYSGSSHGHSGSQTTSVLNVNLTYFPLDDDYNIFLTVTDYAGNTATDSFTLGWDSNNDGEKSISHNNLQPPIIPDASDETSSDSGRISAYNFKSDSTDYGSPTETKDYKLVSSSSSRKPAIAAYRGELYSPPQAADTAAEPVDIKSATIEKSDITAERNDKTDEPDLSNTVEIPGPASVPVSSAAVNAARAGLTKTPTYSSSISAEEGAGFNPSVLLLILPAAAAVGWIYRRRKQ